MRCRYVCDNELGRGVQVMVEVRVDTRTGQNDQRNVLNGVVVIVLAVNSENPRWNPARNNAKF